MSQLTSPLLTELYHLNMIQAYLDHGQTDTAVFEFFVRKSRGEQKGAPRRKKRASTK
jgi:nicotinic acid phosphoribosyltransferase